MNDLSGFDPVNNPDFLELYPQFYLLFKEFKEANPTTYSKLLWAFALDRHPKSIYRNLDIASRRNLIETEYYGEKIDWDNFTTEIEKFANVVLSSKKRILVEWEDKFKERQSFIASVPYNATTYEMLDKLMASTDKVWKQYLTCLKDVEDEEAGTAITEGGFNESTSEQGLI